MTPRAQDRPLSQGYMSSKAAPADADSDLEARTMHVFVTRALQTILKDAPKKHAELRKACTSVIGALLFSAAVAPAFAHNAVFFCRGLIGLPDAS